MVQGNLINFYLTEINKIYDSLLIDQRKNLLEGLESLIKKFGENSTDDRLGKRTIRKKIGLTQKELAQHITGLRDVRSFTPYISMFENGYKEPSDTDFGRKYLAWLKENGYKEKYSSENSKR